MTVIWSKVAGNVVGAFVSGVVGALMAGADVVEALGVGASAALALLTGLFQTPYKPAEKE